MMNRRDFTRCASAAAIAAVSPEIGRASTTLPQFIYKNDFWINLHHTLYFQCSALQLAYESGTSHVSGMNATALADFRRARSTDAAPWMKALSIYQVHYARLDNVFSVVMRNADDTLSFDSLTQPPPSLPAPMRAALDAAAPVYRQALWPGHRASNEAFIRRTRTVVARHHDEMATTLARIYRTPWLQQPYRTDVVQYADWEGSYSNNSNGYVHIVISAQDHYDADMSIADVIFHEASHSIADPEYGTIGSAITKTVLRDGVLAPDQFWHAVIMYTPGKVAEQIAAQAGGHYRMVWMMPGLFGGAWSRYYDALQQYWLPYMRGEGDLEGALARCIDSITQV